MPDCPPLLKACKNVYDHAYGQLDRDDDMDLEDGTDRSPITTPVDLRNATRLPSAVLSARHRYNGTIYSRASTHVGNSLVYFYAEGITTSDPIPGSIKYIYQPTNGTVTYAVQRQIPVADGTLDPFRHYPDIPAKLYSSQLSDSLDLVNPDWVIAQYARWVMHDEYAVVLSLFQVSISATPIAWLHV
jgi:hypothetical protein